MEMLKVVEWVGGTNCVGIACSECPLWSDVVNECICVLAHKSALLFREVMRGKKSIDG